ncbi:MAG: hypothetical protein KF901_06495 [Myxococcales bacterium]|nr:hypothetical protein [Myxococcales bacterium]
MARRHWPVVLLVALACAEEPPIRPPPEPSLELEPPSIEQVVAEPIHREGDVDWPIAPAFHDDSEYASAAPAEARRIVYRVSLIVPRSLGTPSPAIPRPTAELYVDVGRDRLRARFGGTGWPVHAGSEVRLRRDASGVYVFDGEGGRPLGPGQLAHWFEGGRLRASPGHRVTIPPTREQSGPGDLICRLIAEWSSAPPDAVSRRCGEGGSPPSFRVGLWRADRTADVGVDLPRSALRADHVDPPPPIPRAANRAFLTPEMMLRIDPRRGRGPSEPHPSTLGHEPPSEGILVENRAPTRIMVTVQGAPIGWLDAGTSAHYVGLRPGPYEVGAMRPFGLQAAQARLVAAPVTVRLPR